MVDPQGIIEEDILMHVDPSDLTMGTNEGTSLTSEMEEMLIVEDDKNRRVDSSQRGDKAEFNIFQGDTQLESPLFTPRGDVTRASVANNAERFTFVEYPGNVVNFDNAVSTMGGMGKISRIFSYDEKLEVRYRPRDPYCNPVCSESTQSFGILVRVRRRKQKRPKLEPNEQQFLDETEIDWNNVAPVATSDRCLQQQFPDIFGPPTTQDLDEQPSTSNSIQTTEVLRNKIELRNRYYAKQQRESTEIENIVSVTNPIKKVITIPNVDRKVLRRRAARSELSVEVLGLVERSYTFRKGQLCDYQCLPTKMVKGKQVSVLNKILPIFTDPEKDVQFLSDTIENDTKTPVFLAPAFLSRIDKPLSSKTSFIEEAQRFLEAASTGEGINLDKMLEDEGFLKCNPITDNFVVVPMRTRRVIFSHTMDFRGSDDKFLANPEGTYVPVSIMPGAMNDIKKRMETKSLLQVVETLFEDRPIWSKQALEVETKKSHAVLKYVLPAVAYFALNGPWRSLWIKIGYDPRKFPSAFEYQTLDYRMPSAYRNFTRPVSPFSETYYKFKRHVIPPKSQMFYQICDVQIKEVEEIKKIMRARLGLEPGGVQTTPGAGSSPDEVIFSPKFGFMNEETLEYCRYSISRCVEAEFLEDGRISVLTLPPLELLPGGVIPKDILRSNMLKPLHHKRRPKRSFASRPKQDPNKAFLQRGRARRNSGSSSINDLEIDRDDQLGAEQEEGDNNYSGEEGEFYDDSENEELDDEEMDDWMDEGDSDEENEDEDAPEGEER